MKNKNTYDFYLIIATAVVLFVISLICIFGMFYFKLAMIHEMPPDIKVQYMEKMNEVLSPFIMCLILLLGICVPKRMLPVHWMNRFAVVLLICVFFISIVFSIKVGLVFILTASLCLQAVVLIMALGGSKKLNFEKKGYWVRSGSSLMHFGLILFTLDFFFYQNQSLHLILFWITSVTVVLGMIFCFYAEAIVRFVTGKN
jgi:hypothetical protein